LLQDFGPTFPKSIRRTKKILEKSEWVSENADCRAQKKLRKCTMFTKKKFDTKNLNVV